MKLNSYKQLIVWNKSMNLVKMIYDISKEFPYEERYGLVSQIRRASVSVSLNIAEGSKKSTRKAYAEYLRNAHGSLVEVETCIEIALILRFLKDSKDVNTIKDEITQIDKILNKIIYKLLL